MPSIFDDLDHASDHVSFLNDIFPSAGFFALLEIFSVLANVSISTCQLSDFLRSAAEDFCSVDGKISLEIGCAIFSWNVLNHANLMNLFASFSSPCFSIVSWIDGSISSTISFSDLSTLFSTFSLISFLVFFP